ncbi:MAG: inosine/xanthosine triphosphatase [bacterium]|nr:inosine/xanthosine triphosphatase [bacterium]
MRVVIASTNPVKINATKEAFRLMLPELVFEFVAVSAGSGVSDQPMTDAETFMGALNRVDNAKKQNPDADFWVGIEGGLERKGSELEAFAWVVVENKEGMIGKGRTATFFLPPAIVQKIDEGMELGHASDAVFKSTNSKHNKGAIGLLTGGIIDRTKYYIDPAVLALIPFKNKDFFEAPL